MANAGQVEEWGAGKAVLQRLASLHLQKRQV